MHELAYHILETVLIKTAHTYFFYFYNTVDALTGWVSQSCRCLEVGCEDTHYCLAVDHFFLT